MITVGIDPSSSQTGVAVFDKSKLQHTCTYKTSKKLDVATNLLNYYTWLADVLVDCEPNLVIVETAHSRILNVNTFKKIAYYESASMLAAREITSRVVQLGASQARKLALGNGRLSKDEAGAKISALYPAHKFASPDEKDAVCLAIAGFNI